MRCKSTNERVKSGSKNTIAVLSTPNNPIVFVELDSIGDLECPRKFISLSDLLRDLQNQHSVLRQFTRNDSSVHFPADDSNFIASHIRHRRVQREGRVWRLSGEDIERVGSLGEADGGIALIDGTDRPESRVEDGFRVRSDPGAC